MSEHTIIHCYDWPLESKTRMLRIAREFLDNGCRRFVFTCGNIQKALAHPEHLRFLKEEFVPRMGVELVAMHAPFGPLFDLNIPVPERRPGMIADHLRALEIAADFGSRTYTVHVGAYHHCLQNYPLPPLRKFARETLEVLLPRARELGVVIAVENGFEPPNTVPELLDLLRDFDFDPALGICYDTGHANCRASAPWKKMEDYPDYMLRDWLRDGRIITEDDILAKLAPHVVTTHIHDNDGYRDLHGMPGDGTIDWKTLTPQLKACPRMLEFQSEVSPSEGMCWAGKLLAPAGGYSIKRLVDVFRDDLGFGL